MQILKEKAKHIRDIIKALSNVNLFCFAGKGQNRGKVLCVNVTQSMSKAGYPYDNAPMERYFNTLKNECINLYEFTTEEALYQTVEEFAYVAYNLSLIHI